MSEPLLSLCQIVRDEEACLPRCLKSAAPWVDEIVVVDTGSADATREVARRAGARLVEHAWCGDFARARNAALAAARGRFVLVLDGDEWIEGGPHPASLRALLAGSRHEAFTVEINDHLDGGALRRYPLVRLFRNRPEHRYEGAFHEQITPSIARRSGQATLTPPPSALVVGHDGYQLAQRVGRGKAERNRQALERMLESEPHDPVAGYFLARESVPLRHARALPGSHLAQALPLLERLLADAARLPPAWLLDARRLHAAALAASGQAEAAQRAAERLDDGGVPSELVRAGIDLARSGTDPAAAERALARIQTCFDRATPDAGPHDEPALAGPVARARASEALLLLGRTAEARALAEAAVELPGGGACPFLARAAVARVEGRDLDALRDCLAGLQADATDPWAWAAMGELLLAAGALEDALEPLRSAALLAPGWSAVEEALGTALLLAGREEQTLAFFEGRPPGTAPAADAARMLAAAAAGHAPAFTRTHPGTEQSVQRILARIAGAGRPDLLQRLALGLRAVAAEQRA